MVSVLSALSAEQIKMYAPFAYATEPTSSKLSEKYVFSSTSTVIEDMAELGWNVVSARGSNIRRNTKRRTINSFHELEFQNNDFVIYKTESDQGITREVVDCYPRIVLTNSHDGLHSFRFRVALMDVATKQRIMLNVNNMEGFSIRHIYYNFEDLRELVNRVVEFVPTQMEVVANMRNRTLTNEEQRVLALAALRCRKNDDELEVSEDILDDILTDAYNDDTLWNVLNVLQKKMISGEFQTVSKTGKVRKARCIKSITRLLDLSQKMYIEASKFIA